MLSITCPKCGGTNIFDETKTIPTYCSFCGAHLPDMDSYVQDSLKLQVENELLNMEKQRHKMEMEAEEKRIQRMKAVKKDSFGDIVCAIIMLLGIIIFGYILIFKIR